MFHFYVATFLIELQLFDEGVCGEDVIIVVRGPVCCAVVMGY